MVLTELVFITSCSHGSNIPHNLHDPGRKSREVTALHRVHLVMPALDASRVQRCLALQGAQV